MSPGGAASGRKGARYERELVNALREAGWGALRLPSSGSATERELPDILAGTPEAVAGPDGERALSSLWAVEAKCGNSSTLYVDGDEVTALIEYAQRWGARPLLGARYTTRDMGKFHYLVLPGDARITDGGNYGLPKDDLHERAWAVVSPDDGTAFLKEHIA